MDWGLILVVLAIVFLVGHLMFDGLRLRQQLLRLRHVKYETLDTDSCERCRAIKDGLSDIRHEAIWTAAAIVVLAGHITLDFVA